MLVSLSDESDDSDGHGSLLVLFQVMPGAGCKAGALLACPGHVGAISGWYTAILAHRNRSLANELNPKAWLYETTTRVVGFQWLDCE